MNGRHETTAMEYRGAMTPLIYAHRGSSARFAEHTRAAYLQAIADGADGVECDLQLTSDGELVLLHDRTLDRTSNGSGPVAQWTLAELRSLDFCSWKGARIPAGYGGASDQLLTFGELLDILRGAGRDIGLAVEFKYSGTAQCPAKLVDRTLEVLRLRGWLPGPSTAGNILLSFMSFNPRAMEYLAGAVPARHLCQLIAGIADADVDAVAAADPGIDAQAFAQAALAEGERLLDDGVAGIAGPGLAYVRDHADRIGRWSDAGTRFRVWTVDEPDDVRFCAGLGIEEITTNAPAQARAVLSGP
ncbi:glycerophosphodiester phosphodiesterase [Arthrobacter sp. A5]|uniref:glycerophosphodiester phosphodiesterase n=1 Tax=Arthrobacter sp. A5 TaxID=576926 RepID=UPI003DA7D593